MQRNHSLFGHVWSSVRRGHAFSRAKSLKASSNQIKSSPASSVEYLFRNSIKNTTSEGMNHVTAANNRRLSTGAPQQDCYGDEEIPLKQLTCFQNGDEKNYTIIA